MTARKSQARRPTFLRSAVLSALALCVGCAKPDRPARPCTPCGEAFTRDAVRQDELARQWQTVANSVVVAPGAGELDLSCLCFGVGASTVVDDGNIYLPADWALTEQTARAAHLALHRRAAPFRDDEIGSCEVRVQRALEREVDGHVLELETRRALGVTAQRYPFESRYFARPPPQRRVWLRDYFLAQPTGDGVVPGFVQQYRKRCER